MVMEKFESQFEDMDVQSSYMEQSIGQSTASTTPQDQVDELIQQVADENGLERNAEMPGAGLGSLRAEKVGAGASKDPEDAALSARLAALRNPV
jgi:charged multivesicular body protein 1